MLHALTLAPISARHKAQSHQAPIPPHTSGSSSASCALLFFGDTPSFLSSLFNPTHPSGPKSRDLCRNPVSITWPEVKWPSPCHGTPATFPGMYMFLMSMSCPPKDTPSSQRGRLRSQGSVCPPPHPRARGIHREGRTEHHHSPQRHRTGWDRPKRMQPTLTSPKEEGGSCWPFGTARDAGWLAGHEAHEASFHPHSESCEWYAEPQAWKTQSLPPSTGRLQSWAMSQGNCFAQHPLRGQIPHVTQIKSIHALVSTTEEASDPQATATTTSQLGGPDLPWGPSRGMQVRTWGPLFKHPKTVQKEPH